MIDISTTVFLVLIFLVAVSALFVALFYEKGTTIDEIISSSPVSEAELVSNPTVFVSVTGSDSNDGLTLSTAFKTIAAAVTHLHNTQGIAWVGVGQVKIVGSRHLLVNSVERPAGTSLNTYPIVITPELAFTGASATVVSVTQPFKGSPLFRDVKLSIDAGTARLVHFGDVTLPFLPLGENTIRIPYDFQYESPGTEPLVTGKAVALLTIQLSLVATPGQSISTQAGDITVKNMNIIVPNSTEGLILAGHNGAITTLSESLITGISPNTYFPQAGCVIEKCVHENKNIITAGSEEGKIANSGTVRFFANLGSEFEIISTIPTLCDNCSLTSISIQNSSATLRNCKLDTDVNPCFVCDSSNCVLSDCSLTLTAPAQDFTTSKNTGTLRLNNCAVETDVSVFHFISDFASELLVNNLIVETGLAAIYGSIPADSQMVSLRNDSHGSFIATDSVLIASYGGIRKSTVGILDSVTPFSSNFFVDPIEACTLVTTT